MKSHVFFGLCLLLMGYSRRCETANKKLPQIIEETRVFTPKACRRGRFIKTLGNVIADMYAPLLWKEKYYSFSWNKEVSQSFFNVISDDCTPSSFFCETKRLLNLLRDPHCLAISVYPHERHMLPLYFCWINSSLFIQDVQSGFVQGISSGDRVISINGKSAEAVFKQKLISTFGNGPYPNWAHHHICELMVREGAPIDVEIMEKPVLLGILEVDGREKKASVDWMNIYEEHVLYPPPSQEKLLHSMRSIPSQSIAYGKMLIDSPPMGSLSNFFVGSRGSFIEPLGDLVWSSRSDPGATLEAYLAETGNRCIGYLRIPDFSSWSIEECHQYLKRFQQDADCLVLDLMHNPGGIGAQALHLCSSFSSKTVKNHPEMMRLSPALFDWVKEFSYAIRFPNSKRAKDCFQLAGVFFEMDNNRLAGLQRFCDKVTSSLYQEKGDVWPVYWLGLESFEAGKVYTKPLFILCDSLTMSAAESFLLLMKLNRMDRPVWIIGSNTAGVGGAYEAIALPNVEGIKEISYSWSLLIDPHTNKPIEDIGISPDVHVDFTSKDINSSFGNFKDHLLNIIEKNLSVGRIGLYSY